MAAALFSSSLAVAQYSPIQSSTKYMVQIDMTDLTDDQVDVTVVPPMMNEDTVVFAMPKIIPGTYDISDFGRFISEVKAYDSMGNELKVEELDDNRWQIINGKALYKVTYKADDTEDYKGSGIFLPGGTVIEEDGALLNLFGFVGFMVDNEYMPYELEVTKSQAIMPTTTLDILETSETADRFGAQDYFQLHDCPILYSDVESVSMMVAGAEVIVGVYSKEDVIDPKEVLDGIAPVFTATAEYLGGTLPTDRYAVLYWGRTRQEIMSDGAAGALEHFTSTVLVMPDWSDVQSLRHIVAHEFFHIVTPLNIHSEHIHNYDFINPQMSKHLWFYEGITEYNSLISQVRGGILSEEDFMDEMVGKMKSADGFNEHIPMTLRSTHALGIYADQYLDVYQKGALIGMALDLHIRKATGGEQGLRDLLIDLKNTYGPDTFFVDNDFFEIIDDFTPEGTRPFLYDHIAGTTPLPMADLLGAVGYAYREEKTTYEIAEPKWQATYVKARGDFYTIYGADMSDDFTAQFGFLKGDRLVSWNGEDVDGGDLPNVLAEWKEEAALGDEVVVEVLRDGDEIELKSYVTVTESSTRHILDKNENASPEELALRKAWLNQ